MSRAMTEEQIAKLGALRMKHPLTRGALCWIFTDEQLAALIADVRRQAMEEAAQACERVSHGGPYAFAIRARMEEGK